MAVVLTVPGTLRVLPSKCTVLVVSLSFIEPHRSTGTDLHSFTETDVAKETSANFHQLQTWHAQFSVT